MRVLPDLESTFTAAFALFVASAIVMVNRVDQTAAARPEVTAVAQQIAVPAYVNPLADPDAWSRLAATNTAGLGFAVVNIINGPDYIPLDEWTSVFQNMSASGVQLVGYVDTGYLGTTGQRTRLGSTDSIDWMSQIQHDISTWYKFYGSSLAGIFFDQTQNACGPTAGSNEWADLYRRLSDEVERLHPGALNVLNPGIAVPQCYENAGDVIVTFEGSYGSYIGDPASPNTYVPLTWTPVDPRKIWHIVYGASDAAMMSQVISLSSTRSAGYVYVTDDVLANPYDTLPAADYWAAEQAAVTTLPTNAGPPDNPTSLDTVEVYGSSVILDWEGSRSRSARVAAYDIYRDGVMIDSVPGDRLTYTAVDLNPLTSYVFSVVARDALGTTSAASNSLTVVTDASYGESRRPPAGLAVVETTFTSARLAWQPGRQRARTLLPSVAAYVVVQNGREILRLPPEVAGVTVGSLAPGSTYTFSVFTIDESGGRTGDSNSLEVTTPALLDGATIAQPTVTETPEQFAYSADFQVPFAFRRVFIATGNSANTCWFTGTVPQICADYLLENQRLLRYTGSGSNWDWAIVRDVAPVVDGNNFSWSISPADIGSPVTSFAVFHANGYAPNSYCGVGFACVSTGPPPPYE